MDLGSCFQGTMGFEVLAHVFRRPKVLYPGSCFQMLGFLDLGSCFQRTKGFGALAYVFRGPKVLYPGSCFQRPRIFGSWLMFSEGQGFFGLWLMFSEDQRFRILAHVFRGLGFWGLAHVFRGPRVFWALAHVLRGSKVLDPGSCF